MLLQVLQKCNKQSLKLYVGIRTQVQFLVHVSDLYLLCCFIFFEVGGRGLEKVELSNLL